MAFQDPTQAPRLTPLIRCSFHSVVSGVAGERTFAVSLGIPAAELHAMRHVARGHLDRNFLEKSVWELPTLYQSEEMLPLSPCRFR